MSQTEASYLKAWVGTALAVVVLMGITWLSSAILATKPVDTNAGGTPLPGEENPALPAPGPITVEGTFTCLPHRDTTGPHTLECAIGFRADDGLYYGLDVSAVTYPADVTRARITGHIIPAAALSTNAWQKYDMQGIILVESVVPL